MKKQEETIKGVKGFDKDLKCRGLQYEIGKEYETDKKPVRCTANGFHFCENPLDVFAYYSPSDSKYHEVEGSGQKDTSNEDSKIAVSKIKIGVEIGLKDIIERGVKFIFERTKWTKENNTTGYQAGSQATGYQAGSQATGYQAGSQATGYRAGSQATGYRAGSQATGDRAGSQATGDRAGSQATGYRAGSQATGYQAGSQATGDRAGSQATGDQAGSQATGDRAMSSTNGYRASSSVIGEQSVACGLGIRNKAKASLNSWIVLAERDDGGIISHIKSAKVDDKKIKANTFYILRNNKFIIAE